MRTTVTLEDDVEKQLRSAVRRSGRPFKQVLNEALREGLGRPARRAAARFRQPTFDLGRPLVDLTKAAALSSELEDQHILAKLGTGDAATRR